MDSPAVYRGYDRAGLDDQYDHRIPDREDYLARWAAGAAEARRRFPHVLDVPYGPLPPHRLDVYRPAPTAGGLPPIFFYVHGGYWHRHDKSVAAHLALVFAEAGALLVTPGYSRVPEAALARVVEDVATPFASPTRTRSAWGAIASACTWPGSRPAPTWRRCSWPRSGLRGACPRT